MRVHSCTAAPTRNGRSLLLVTPPKWFKLVPQSIGVDDDGWKLQVATLINQRCSV